MRRYLILMSYLLMMVACGSSGESVAKVGESCANTRCEEGAYCKYPLGDCGESSSSSGVCELIPEMCAQIYQPVCGCDGKTYGNECSAASMKISLRSLGECEKN